MSGTVVIASTILLASLALFQAALALGAPWGRFAWGGQHERLPGALRIGSVVAIFIYAGILAVQLQKAAMISLLPAGNWIDPAVWAIAAYYGLGIVLNAISRSRAERIVMTPLVAVLFGLALVIALGL